MQQAVLGEVRLDPVEVDRELAEAVEVVSPVAKNVERIPDVAGSKDSDSLAHRPEQCIANLPLESRATVIELIGRTTTKTGLKVECALDERSYEKGIRISKAEMRKLAIEGDAFHPEWNYTIKPRPTPP